jgi:NAD-dependent histone deacetylase SIR2
MTEDDGAPPAKRRRLSPSTSMPRETRRLDLNERLLEEQPDEHEQLVKALKNKRKIVVVAGAGISVNAGSEFNFAYQMCLHNTRSFDI